MAGKCGTVISEVWRYESALVALNTAKDAILRAFGIEGRKYVSDGSYCRHGVEIAIDDCIVSRTGWWQIREEGKVISLIDGDTVSYFYIVGRCPADDIVSAGFVVDAIAENRAPRYALLVLSVVFERKPR
jgi:hypothetical protein